jgi:GTP-binding protein
MANLFKVAIVGRTNVGKSTLFNRLISHQKAIVSKESGTTRDRNYAICSWGGLDFILIDTAGMHEQVNDEVEEQVQKQSFVALEEADLILFVTDTTSGIMSDDKTVAKVLKKHKKKVILVANKADTSRLRQQIADFFRLGFAQPIPISAKSGSGCGDLLDEVVKTLSGSKNKSKLKTAPPEEKSIRVALFGQPNVGKSSLINALIGQERLIVSSIPHTTRDNQDILLTYHGKHFTFVDTAGLRKKNKRLSNIFEKLSTQQSLQSIKKSHIAVLVTDVSKPLNKQDKQLLKLAADAGKGIIILANKWDLIVNKDTNTINTYTQYYRRFFPFVAWAPILFTSATSKAQLSQLLPLVLELWENMNKFIDDNALDRLLKNSVKQHKPSRGKGTKHPYIYHLRQIKTLPPIFAIKVDFKSDLHFSYFRFLENQLRFKFGFNGVPIVIRKEKTQNIKDKH